MTNVIMANQIITSLYRNEILYGMVKEFDLQLLVNDVNIIGHKNLMSMSDFTVYIFYVQYE